MTKEEYLLNEEKVTELLNSIREKISPSSLEGIEHYLEHGEMEMAYELLCLELINKNISFQQNEKDQVLKLAEALGLSSDSVYEPDFWGKLNIYLTES